MLDDDLLKKLRTKQAKLVKKSTKSISLSNVINDTIRKNIWKLSYKSKLCDDCKRMKCTKGCTCDCHFSHNPNESVPISLNHFEI